MPDFPEQDSVLVHVGFPKALSSWLQKKWFTPDNGYSKVMDPVQVQLQLIDPSPFAFDAQPVREWLHAAIADSKGLCPVVTSESLSGNMYSGGYNGKECIDRVAQVMPQAKILLVVREQRALIRSMYKSLVTWGMPHSIDRLLDPVEPRLAPQFNMDFLCFDQRLAYYHELFGPERVLVLAYENFERNPEGFLRNISSFAGLPRSMQDKSAGANAGQRVNAGQTLANLYLQRWHNYFFLSNPFNYSGLRVASDDAWKKRVARSKRDRLPAFTRHWFEVGFAEKVRRRTEGEFAASNQALQALSGLDLAALGYQL